MYPCTYVVAVGIKVRTCDKGSIGERTSCLRVASRAGLGPLEGEQLVVECALLRCELDEGRLECGVFGLAVGITVNLGRPLHGTFGWHVGAARGQR